MSKINIEEFDELLEKIENTNLEFKEAKVQFDNNNLQDYCAALANEGGGKFILGVNNNRKVIGTKAYHYTYNKLSNELFSKIKIRVDVEELLHPAGRVLIFYIPSHPIGQPVQSNGKYKYPMRLGESLSEMDSSKLKEILNEMQVDFSCKTVNDFCISDIDEIAIKNFKERWAQKSKRDEYLTFSNEKILQAADLLSSKR